jgi:general secretion pathway protein F
MPSYRYQALSPDGKKVIGLIEADSLLVAKERLRSRKILVTDLVEEKKRKGSIGLKLELKLSLMRELAQLLKAGLPLYECLVTIEEKSRKEKHHPLLIDLIDRLKQGEGLSSAMRKYPKVFDAIDLSMIAAAEESGTLPEAFSQLYHYLEKQVRWKKQLLSVTTYPTFLLVFSLFIFFALLFFLIPSMQELYEGRQLQPLTQAILSLSQFCRKNILLLGGGLFAAISGIVLMLRNPRCRQKASLSALHLPFVGDVIVQMIMVRFSRACSILLKSSVPLLDTLKLARPTLRHAVFEQALLDAEAKILEGHSLYEQLKLSKRFPLIVVRLLAIAEETGRMKEAFDSLGEIYDEELAKNLERLTTVLQPALLLLLGIIVGVMILAVLLPLTDVSSFLN